MIASGFIKGFVLSVFLAIFIFPLPYMTVASDNTDKGKVNETILRLSLRERKLMVLESILDISSQRIEPCVRAYLWKPPSYSDPVRFSFAHGGKDGTPFPVDRKTYDRPSQITNINFRKD